MKSKKWLALLLSAAMLVPVGVAGCDKGNDGGDKDDDKDGNTLAAPQVTLNGNVLSWAAVENAESYIVYLKSGTNTQTVSEQTGLTYTIPQTEAGDYEYSVVAQNKTLGIKSGRSEKVTYTIAPDTSVLFSGNIYVVGDSTVSAFSDNYYLPRYGYGTQLYNYINCESSHIKNLALSGRSSLSYLKEGNYTTLKTSISAGDYLIIGFGHNDEKKEQDKYTDPNGDKETAGSFQKNLYDNYIKLAKDKGATPVLCTPIVRLSTNNDYSGSEGHITADGDYAKAIRDLGADTGTLVVDLTAITKADYSALGFDEASNYHCWTATKNGVRDGLDKTHTNLYGAKMNAYYIAQTILNSDCALKTSIKTNAIKPSYDVDYAAGINPNYVDSNYGGPDMNTRSSVWSTVKNTDWYASAFGDIGAANTANFTITQNGVDSFTVGSAAQKGKIASGGDGLACVFMQLDPNRNFEITADVALTTVNDNAVKQSAFGIMLRDEMYIDTVLSTVNGNSVIAGGYTGSSETANYCFNYQRLDGSLSTKSSQAGGATNFTQGETFTLKMEKINRTVHCTVTKGGTEYKSTYTDISFTGIDTAHVYLCLFGTRGIVATFSNVVYTAGDISEGA